jgi:hypothetical protein
LSNKAADAHHQSKEEGTASQKFIWKTLKINNPDPIDSSNTGYN